LVRNRPLLLMTVAATSTAASSAAGRPSGNVSCMDDTLKAVSLHRPAKEGKGIWVGATRTW
jgi:hypothetical protein